MRAEGIDTDSRELDEIISILSKANDALVETKNKDVILFLGKTGTGKSAAINYLKGIDYKKERSEAWTNYLIKLSEEKEFVKVGDGTAAETGVPYSVLFKENTFYLDCPGYAENRENNKICSNVLRQIAIKGAKNIRAIIICYQYEDNPRQSGLFELVNWLNSCVEDLSQLPAERLVFLITKAPDEYKVENFLKAIKNATEFKKSQLDPYKEAQKVIHGQLKNIILSDEKNKDTTTLLPSNLKVLFEKIQGSPSAIELQKEISALEQIENSAKFGNIVVLQPTDKGITREITTKILYNLIQQPVSIPKTQFRLPLHDESTNKFNVYIAQIVSFGTFVINVIANLKDDIVKLDQQLKDKITLLSSWQKKINEIKQKGDDPDTTRDLFQLVKSERLENINSEIKEIKNEQKNLMIEIEALNRAIEEKESNSTEIKYWQPDPVSFPINHWVVGLTVAAGTLLVAGTITSAFFPPAGTVATTAGAVIRALITFITGGSGLGRLATLIPRYLSNILMKKTFEYEQKHVSFKRIEKICDHGSFTDEKENKEQKTYEITFIPNPFMQSTAKVAGILEVRNIPETRRLIQSLHEELQKNNEKLTTLTSKLKEKQKDKEKIAFENMSSIIKTTTNEIEKLQEEKEKNEIEFKEYNKFLQSNEKVYSLINTVHQISPFEFIGGIDDFIKNVRQQFYRKEKEEKEYKYETPVSQLTGRMNPSQEDILENESSLLSKASFQGNNETKDVTHLSSSVSVSSSSSTVSSSLPISSIPQYTPITKETFEKSLEEFQKAFDTQDKFLNQYLEENPSDRQIAITCAKQLRNQYLRLKNDLEHLKEASQEIKEMECKAFEQALVVAAANVEKIEISYAKIKPLPIINSTPQSISELSQSPGVKSPIYNSTISSSTSGITASNNGSSLSNTTTTVLPGKPFG